MIVHSSFSRQEIGGRVNTWCNGTRINHAKYNRDMQEYIVGKEVDIKTKAWSKVANEVRCIALKMLDDPVAVAEAKVDYFANQLSRNREEQEQLQGQELALEAEWLKALAELDALKLS